MKKTTKLKRLKRVEISLSCIHGQHYINFWKNGNIASCEISGSSAAAISASEGLEISIYSSAALEHKKLDL